MTMPGNCLCFLVHLQVSNPRCFEPTDDKTLQTNSSILALSIATYPLSRCFLCLCLLAFDCYPRSWTLTLFWQRRTLKLGCQKVARTFWQIYPSALSLRGTVLSCSLCSLRQCCLALDIETGSSSCLQSFGLCIRDDLYFLLCLVTLGLSIRRSGRLLATEIFNCFFFQAEDQQHGK